jgi:ComF family protein
MSWGLTFRNILFPQFCRGCGVRILTEENGFFCPDCWESSPLVPRPFCTICGQPHPRGVGLFHGRNFPCGPCAARRDRNGYDRLVGVALYTGAVEEAVKLLKFNGKRRLASPLGALMAETALRELDADRHTLVVPVPLHRVRLRHRGYNQSRLLAAEVAAVLPGAVLCDALARVRPTRTQSRIKDPARRRANIRGAFALVPGTEVKGAHVLLIDDVATTGGTVGECARVLRRAGAASVEVLVAALAVKGATRAELEAERAVITATD